MAVALNQESVVRRQDLLALLHGDGIEIGALHRPCHVPHLNVKYLDRCTVEELLIQYPELKELPLVNPDIIDDAEDLSTIADSSLDFVLANHVIEHMANPLKALSNWSRVLKKGGHLFLAVPEHSLNFDRERPLTSWQHVLEDYLSPSPERDFEHFREFALHVSCRFFNVKPESEYEEFARELWSKQYSIHYHVWNFSSFGEVLNRLPETLERWPMVVVGKAEPNIDEFVYVLRCL
jgi:predicted SAM-dependent methyltransferase